MRPSTARRRGEAVPGPQAQPPARGASGRWPPPRRPSCPPPRGAGARCAARGRGRASTRSARPGPWPGTARRSTAPAPGRWGPGRQRLRLVLDDRSEGLDRGLSLEGRAPGHHLVEHRAEGELVGAVVHRTPARLLGRHVPDRAHDDARGGVGRPQDVGPGRHLRDVLAGRPLVTAAVAAQLGEAEVEDLHVAVARQHHVLGLEVAVDDAGGVRAGEPVGQLAGDVEHLPGRQRELGANQVAQRRAVHELHDGEGQPGRLADLVDGDDVGVVEGRGRAGLLGESTEAVRDRGEGLGQELDGDVAAEVEVPRTVDLAHAPRAQLVEELVPAEPHADHGWHGCWMICEPGSGYAPASGRVKGRVEVPSP